MRYQDKDCPRGQIRVYSFAEIHWHSHRWRGNEERNLVVPGLDNVRVAYYKLAMMVVEYLPPEARLNVGAEVIKVESINAAVHEAVAISGTYDSIAFYIEDRSTVDGYEIKVATESSPCVNQRFFDSGQNKFHLESPLQRYSYGWPRRPPNHPDPGGVSSR